MAQQNRTAVLEDVVILPNSWRNFAGERRRFNPEGARNFNIKINKEQYDAMLADGWPVRVRESTDEFDEPLYYMQCKLYYHRDRDTGVETSRGPKVKVVTSSGVKDFDNHMVKELDNMEIKTADIALRQSPWTDDRDGGKTKYSAYCNELWVTIEESFLERKYGQCEGDECEVGMPMGMKIGGPGTDLPPWEED